MVRSAIRSLWRAAEVHVNVDWKLTALGGASLALVAVVAACSGGSGVLGASTDEAGAAPILTSLPDGAPIDAAASPTDGGASVAPSTSGPLELAALTTTTSEISGVAAVSEPTEVTFLAIVTHKNGLDEIAGGTLHDDAGKTYGAFGAGDTKSTFALTLSWSAITKIRPIEFAAPGTTRTFIARFHDNGGHTVEAAVVIGLHCGGARSMAACGGTCASLDSSVAHCGACGRACTDRCTEGVCAPSNACFTPSGFAGLTCADRCRVLGARCVDGSVTDVPNSSPPMRAVAGAAAYLRFACGDRIPANPIAGGGVRAIKCTDDVSKVTFSQIFGDTMPADNVDCRCAR